MANYVTISTIASKPFAPDVNVSLQEAVEQMKIHIKEEVDKVLPDKPDLIVLPEVCDIPFKYPAQKRVDFYHIRKDQILDLIRDICRENRCYIVCPALRDMKDGTWIDSAILVNREGKIEGIYDKNYPPIHELECEGIIRGTEAPIIESDFGRVAFAICFDLNYDELRLKYAKGKPDIIVFPSLFHGGHMQNYWESSCRSYFVGAVAGLRSSIISPVGEEIAYTTNYTDYVTKSVNLDCAVVHLDYNSKKLRDMKKKYGTKVKIIDPGFIASVLISSETDEFTIEDMIKEFDIELLDDYLVRGSRYGND